MCTTPQQYGSMQLEISSNTARATGHSSRLVDINPSTTLSKLKKSPGVGRRQNVRLTVPPFCRDQSQQQHPQQQRRGKTTSVSRPRPQVSLHPQTNENRKFEPECPPGDG